MLFCTVHLLITTVSNQLITKNHLIGVHPNRRNIYEQIGDQEFKCLDGSRAIPASAVNDDYCDCMDASDEPGTSACPHGQFFCQNDGYIQKLIPSAWVNDGQCDCCDASDEYNSTSSVCQNTCGTLGEIYRQEQEKLREISDKGSAVRSQYKEEARVRREQNSQLLEQYKRELSEKENAIRKIEEELNFDFGPGQVFFPLKGKCFSFRDREYTYTLCPFERATQESTGGMQTELGRWSGWSGPAENLYSRQKYDGGIQCWNGPARSAVVNVVCGVEDKLTSVVEPSKCEYVFDFQSPAACPDLDPPEPSLEQPAESATETASEEGSDTANEDSKDLHETAGEQPDELSRHEHEVEDDQHDEL